MTSTSSSRVPWNGSGSHFLRLIPGSLAIIGASFPDERRGQAIGTWSALTAIATAVGPVLGGLLVDHLGWRWVFFVNVPLAIVRTAYRHPPPARESRRVSSRQQGSHTFAHCHLALADA